MATSTMTRTSDRPSVASGRSETAPRRRHPRWLRLLVLLVVLAVLGTGTWLLGFSSVFATREVAVSGTSVLTPAAVRAAAAAPIGVPLARQDLRAMSERIAALPPVESVTAERRWPDTIAFTVTERTAVIAVKRGSSFQLVDRHGIAFDDVSSVPEKVVTATVDLADGPVLVDVAGVAGQLPASLRADVTSIKATTRDDITLVLHDGPTVVWGSPDQTVFKAQVLQVLLDQKGSFTHIDVSAPHNPAVR